MTQVVRTVLVIARSEATKQSLDRFAALAMTGKTCDDGKNLRRRRGPAMTKVVRNVLVIASPPSSLRGARRRSNPWIASLRSR